MGQAQQSLTDSGPWPLVVRESVPLLTVPTPRVDPHLEDVERRLSASQLGI